MDRSEAVERLLGSYSAYYDIVPIGRGDLVARCDFHFRGEKYLLTRGVNLWSEEDHEYVYVFSGGRLDAAALAQMVISIVLFCLAIVLMSEGLRTLRDQRRAPTAERE